MSKRSDWLTDLSAAIAKRHWDICPKLLYRVLYGAPATDLLALTAHTIERYWPSFESRWPSVKWPREIVAAPQDWILRFGRAVPDAPEPERNSDAKFLFSLDAFLLAWSNLNDVSILASSCACGILEAIGAMVLEGTDEKTFSRELAADQGCGCGSAKPRNPPLRDPGAPIELARSREWQNFLDVLVTTNVVAYPDVPSLAQLEADLAHWERHAMLLIVPEAAALLS